MTQEFLNDFDERVIALAQHLGLNLEPDFESYVDEETTEEEQQKQREEAIREVIRELSYIVEGYDNCYNYYGQEYLVLTDEEADEEEEKQLDSYLEQCIYPEIPENLRDYFDDEAWKSDARIDGRGHLISTDDGCEYDETVNGTTYYIYRV